MAAPQSPSPCDSAARLPGPPELLPGRPDAIVDLQTEAGAALVGAQWRYTDAQVREIDFVAVGGPGAADPLGPGDVPNRTYDVVPHAQARRLRRLAAGRRWRPADTMRRLAHGRVCFNWYRTAVTIPERIGDLDPTGATVVFEVVDRRLRRGLGRRRAAARARRHRRPGRRRLQRAQPRRAHPRRAARASASRSPCSASTARSRPRRTTTSGCAPRRSTSTRASARASRGRRRSSSSADARPRRRRRRRTRARAGGGRLRVHRGPGVEPATARCCSARRTPTPSTAGTRRGEVTVFRSKSGYTGADIGRYHQPGSNGLTFDPDGPADDVPARQPPRRAGRAARQHHGARRPYEGRRLNRPNDLVYRSDGTLYFTDPPFGLPDVFDDPAKELPFSGVFARPRRRGLARHRRARRAPTASPSRPTSATSTSATGTRERKVDHALRARRARRASARRGLRTT